MKKYISWVGIIALLILNVFMGVRMTTLESELKTLQNKQPEQVIQTTQVVHSNQSDVSEVYQKVAPSVVTVINIPHGTGSGVIYLVDGNKAYIITNHHVIDQSQNVKIILNTGEELDAKVLGSDSLSDIALLEVNTDLDLVPIEIGDSSLLNVGETVLAIGSPSGQNFSGSLSVGVVSGKDRVIEVDTNNDRRPDWEMVLVQTDAAINPGNSGGALVNMAGQLVGINTLKLLDLTVEGMGFANPVNEVVNILSQIKEDGKVSRPMIGISAISMEDLILRSQFYNLETPDIAYGVYVNEVVENSPAEAAGILAGDVIIEIDNQEIRDFKSFRRNLYQFKSGDSLSITVFRNNQKVEKTLTLD